ncbi:DUF6340 family protein [Draconibacterium halophilum]|uniref:Tetratricopeptide repeat protein n=1 Tax=Draconibacterium halophilum TaxID=2706887 RepID=A0A6C0RCT0_9BACT|nr:DUF6340 family protein [Draconibacterium halophilum]QIA08458.1 hypothetical protein G0Q07_12375 [Draconibacterium halophilum]
MSIFKQTNYILLVSIVLLSYACSPTKRILVEFPQKPKNEISQDVQSLLLVNRTVDGKYNDLPTDSLQKIFYQKDFNLDTTIYDLTAVDTSLKALGELLFESGRFDYVIPEDRFLNAEQNAFFTQTMSWEEAQELCDLYQTDAVLSMDLFKTRVVTELAEESIFDPNEGFFRTAVGAKMVIVYNALFRLYDPQQEKVLAREVIQDTLIWEDYALSVRNLFMDFTPVKQALTEAGIAVALDFSETIGTRWHRDYRIIFDKGSSALKKAAAFTDDANWTKAIEAWETIATGSGSKREKSKALFNLATACEIRGDLDCAIEYALESYNTAYHPITYQYLELLESRKKQQKNNTK